MTDIIIYYKRNFVFSSEHELGKFVSFCINNIESYISYLVFKGKIFLPFELSPLDAAIEVSSDIFTRKDNQLTKFNNFFSSLEKQPIDDSDFVNCLNGFLFTVTKNNLLRIFAEADPQTYRIMRNLQYEIKQRNYYVSILFDDKYIHKREIDFSKSNVPSRDDVLKVLQNSLKSKTLLSNKDILKNVFSILDSQSKYAPAIAFNDLVYFIKLISLNTYRKNEANTDIESDFHYKFLFDSVKMSYFNKLNQYFQKKGFSEKERNSIYNITDDFMKNLLNGGIRKSPAELTKEFFHDNDYSKYVNKVEYCLELLVNELSKEIKEVEKNG